MTCNIMSLTVFFQIPLNRRMVQKRRQVVIKGKFREHHNLLRQIGSEVPIHTAVDGIHIVMWAHSFLIEPGPTKMISHFIHHGWIKGLGPSQDVSSGAEPCRPCPYHRYTSSTPLLHFPELFWIGKLTAGNHSHTHTQSCLLRRFSEHNPPF